MRIKCLKILSALAALSPILTGCKSSGHVARYDAALIPFKSSIQAIDERQIQVCVDGQKVFAGRPYTILGKIFELNLDLERIQIESAKRMSGVNAVIGTNAPTQLTLRSAITDFKYRLVNVGALGQKAAVSFGLRTTLLKNGTVISETTSTAKDFQPSDAEFKSYFELLVGPLITAYGGKADRLAQSAFVATALFVCQKYAETLAQASLR